MRNDVFIPEKINVGFQKRDGTYTGKLAYVVYFDNKGVLRKEKSWQSWRDKNIPNEIYENKPTEGFVLNKKVGGTKCHWNPRQTYVRVYDPRGFEFELTVPNLLYILENTSSIKGKGLEGEFVYGYSGTDLVLIPTSSPDYEELMDFNAKLKTENPKAKDLVLGGTYLDNKNQELIYMGRFDYWTINYGESRYNYTTRSYEYTPSKDVNKGLHHIFAQKNSRGGYFYTQMKSISKRIISVVSAEPSPEYPTIFEDMECQTWYSPLDESKTEYVSFTFDEFIEAAKGDKWIRIYNYNGSQDDSLHWALRGHDNQLQALVLEERKNNPDFELSEVIKQEADPHAEGSWCKKAFAILNPYHKYQYLKNGKKMKE
jgi:hypothetical protein